jgi:N utilization substance protein B
VLALQYLYARDLRGPDASDDLLDWLCDEYPAAPSARRAAAAMVAAIAADPETIDDLIQRHAPALPVNLLAVVDRNILRVAIYELTNREQLPRNVVVNEAVELASMFGSESSARFVNGVLGSVLNDLTVSSDKDVE